ncbi:hypothetical protein N2152v2_010073 [Parachlorella kessleri]
MLKPQKEKLRVVVLGSGWGAMSFLRNVDGKVFADDGAYELTVVSPRDVFLFTPLLPSAMSGTVEESTVVTPIERFVRGKGIYLKAACTDIDPAARLLTCQNMGDGASDGLGAGSFQVPYDVLILAVGSVNNTFGTPGAADHCWFLKTIDDARRLRDRIRGSIHAAAEPGVSPEERQRLLSFVVVGGGPSGVEVAAELHDLVAQDVARDFPHIKDDISITLVDAQDRVLGTFNEDVSRYAGKLLSKEGVRLMLEAMVLEVKEESVTVKKQDGSVVELRNSTCVWTAGIAPNPLVELLRHKLGPSQGDRGGLVVDTHLRVAGSEGSIIALGDAAVTNQLRAAEHAEELFRTAPTGPDGKVAKKALDDVLALAGQEHPQLGEVAPQLGHWLCPDWFVGVTHGSWVVTKVQAGQEYPQLGEVALQLDDGVFGAASRALFPSSGAKDVADRHRSSIERGLDLDGFRQLLTDADGIARRLAPTAQVARQQGEYLAALFSNCLVQRAQHERQEGGVALSSSKPEGTGTEGGNGATENGNGATRGDTAAGASKPANVEFSSQASPFLYIHLGSLAYLGMNRAVMQLPPPFGSSSLKGLLAAEVWRMLELLMQVSAPNTWMLAGDFVHTRYFGRRLNLLPGNLGKRRITDETR